MRGWSGSRTVEIKPQHAGGSRPGLSAAKGRFARHKRRVLSALKHSAAGICHPASVIRIQDCPPIRTRSVIGVASPTHTRLFSISAENPRALSTASALPLSPAMIGVSCAPDHHGYQRACNVINGQASNGQTAHQGSHAPGRPVLHFISSRADRGVKSGTMAWLSPDQCSSFVRGVGPFLCLGLNLVQRHHAHGTVRAGRRSSVGTRSSACRSRLDRPE